MEKKKQYDEIDLSKLGKALWHKFWLILLIAFVLGGAAFAYSAFFVTPMYESEATMYVNNNDISIGSTSVSISSGELTARQKLVDTYIVILKSRTTLNKVKADVGLDYSYDKLRKMISAAPVNNTEIFSIKVKSADPEEAMKIANSVAVILKDNISQIVDGSSARIVDYAIVNSAKVSPSITKNCIIGFVIGAIVGCIIIVIRTLTDTIIRDEEYLTETYNLPVLAAIPDLLHIQEKSKQYSSYSSYTTSSKDD